MRWVDAGASRPTGIGNTAVPGALSGVPCVFMPHDARCPAATGPGPAAAARQQCVSAAFSAATNGVCVACCIAVRQDLSLNEQANKPATCGIPFADPEARQPRLVLVCARRASLRCNLLSEPASRRRGCHFRTSRHARDAAWGDAAGYRVQRWQLLARQQRLPWGPTDLPAAWCRTRRQLRVRPYSLLGCPGNDAG